MSREYQKGSGAKAYMRKGILIYEEMCEHLSSIRKPLPINDFAHPMPFKISQFSLIVKELLPIFVFKMSLQWMSTYI
jgi:hypothetical protein